ncbi:hypothetical protein OG429_36015 [Streptomyces sp. NBC_00190]|uniref:hypothetical protein n=1 Tax=unclassified Streptomyces TaxID=2593676 RepID=UPI002E2D24BE|nr:hypothetical protein [Streptomyces sp. NBC_00190]WSZ44201.1 hypothetical protein OG239_38480 [Streptomyces sp. NBC_00868]
MNHTAHINHDAVLRARVALLGSETLPVRQQVAAFRVLVQVSPLAYLPLLTEALYEYSRQEFAHQPGTALALRAESVAAARRMHALEPERAPLLLTALIHYAEQLSLMGRHDELAAVKAEITLLGKADPHAR